MWISRGGTHGILDDALKEDVLAFCMGVLHRGRGRVGQQQQQRRLEHARRRRPRSRGRRLCGRHARHGRPRVLLVHAPPKEA